MTSLQATAAALQPALGDGMSRWLRRLAAAVVARREAAAAPHALRKGATGWVSSPRGHCVRCDAGTLWLTHDGEPLDIVLEAGESHLCMKSSPLSIHALTDAVLRVA